MLVPESILGSYITIYLGVQSYLLSKAQPGSWDYHSDVLTDQSPQEICCNLIREQLLEHLPQEVPYNITQVLVVDRTLTPLKSPVSAEVLVQRLGTHNFALRIPVTSASVFVY